jgi:hypothetical protein
VRVSPGESGDVNAVSTPFQRRFNAVLTPFQRRFNAVSTLFQRHFNAVSTPFQRHFNAVEAPFQRHFNAGRAAALLAQQGAMVFAVDYAGFGRSPWNNECGGPGKVSPEGGCAPPDTALLTPTPTAL